MNMMFIGRWVKVHAYFHYLLKLNKMKSPFFLKRNILAFFLFLNIHFIISQTNEQNLEKYWHYRYRLTNYFMVVGDGAGESLPADIRNLYNGGIMHFGETPVQLGYYLGVLATEYHLLKNNNQNTDRTLTELYYALIAAARLDLVSDGIKNGYLYADDVNPNTFLTVNHKAKLNYNIDVNQTISTPNSGEIFGVDQIVSDYPALEPSASQDMLYNLLMGLALVKKYVGDGSAGIHFSNYINGNLNEFLNFEETAKQQAHLVVSYIKCSPFDNVPIYEKNWRLSKPDGTVISNGHGGNALPFAFGVAKAGEFFTGTDYTDFIAISWAPIWQQFQNESVGRVNFSDVTMTSIIAAIGDSWRDRSLTSNDNTTKEGILFNGDYEASVIDGKFWDANHHGLEIFYGAVHRLLHGYNLYDAPMLDMCKMQSMLNTAPKDGPYCHSPTDLAPDGWASTRRFYTAPPAQDTGQNPPGPDFQGNYSGLDYMLLHNLYYCLQEGSVYISETMPNNDNYFMQYYIGAPYISYETYRKTIIQNTLIHEKFGSLYGAALITGGPQGVELNNIEVIEGAELTISTDNDCAVDPDDFIFDSFNYKNLIINNEPQNDSPPPYKMIPESELSKSTNLRISPNPNNGTFKIILTKNEAAIGVKDIKVYDIVGRIIWENITPSGNTFNIDISANAPGIYYVRAINEAGDIEIKKLIKN